MGMTLVQRLIATRGGYEQIEPGQRASVEVDRFLLGEADFYHILKRTGFQEAARPKGAARVVVALEQFVGALEGELSEAPSLIRRFSKCWEILHLYELGRGGIETIIYSDGGMVRPGDFVVGGESQLSAFGAFGALALALDEDSLFEALQEGKVSFEVPETIKVVFRGSLNRWVGGKDLAIFAHGMLGSERVKGKALEFGGEAVMELDMPERLALTTFASNLGARCLMIEADEKTRIFTRARSDKAFKVGRADDGAEYADIIEVDASRMEPQVFIPSRPEKALGVSKVDDLKIDQVVIGTGGNGRIEDLRRAAGLLREYLVRKDVRLILVPGSQQIYLHAMEEGLIQIFLRAGAHLGLPSMRYTEQCHRQGIEAEEQCLTTSGILYPDPGILYCNPAVAAASAVMGSVKDPYEMMRTIKRKPTGLIG